MPLPRPRHPYLDVAHPIALAHRGGARGGPENTMAAFARAVDAGFTHLETDVQATADGVLLAFHDERLDRVTDRCGRVDALPYGEVAKARIGGVEPVARLEDVLGTWPHVRVNVDVKAASAIGPLLDVLRRSAAIDRVCVASFSDARLRAVRAAAGPRLATSTGPREVLALRLHAWRLRPLPRLPAGVVAAQVPLRAAHLPVVDDAFVAGCHRAGLDVHVWTIDDAGTMHRLLDLGVDGIVTDDLDTLVGVYGARGVWP